jgi:hypothetical protein
MKHAGPDALDQLNDVLLRLREIPTLVERSRGVFYRSNKAFLHFHEDPTGLYADMRQVGSFERVPGNSISERDALVHLVRRAMRVSSDR